MTRRLATASLAVWLGAIAPATSQDRPPEGTRRAFETGLVALHHFEYEQAAEAFREARRADPSFALAYWGEAMTYHQTLWRNENVPAARAVLARLGPTPGARAAKAADSRERGLLAAADALFGERDDQTRRRRYVETMARLAGGYPDDPDIVSLYALALLGTTSRSLIGFGDARDPELAGSELQSQVASLLTGVLARHPEHPGALHYLIHAYDDPQHASLALGAARTYAQVARGASHALHMPAHVFLQLGMWSEAASSDRAAYDASSEWVRRKALPPALRNYHALSWLQYELLQQGRYAEARDLIQQLEPVVAASGGAQAGHDMTHQPLLSDLSSMRARYVIESRRWEVLAGQTNFGNVNDLFAIGMGAARTGNVRVAQTVRQALADRAASPQEGDLRPAIAIMEREIAGLIALADGRRDEALAILQSAAQAESILPAPLGLPAPIKPAPELLGEVLIETGRPGDAIAPFESVLRLHANRSLSVLGLARAAAASGQTAMARQRYQELLANFEHADADLAELPEARGMLDRPAPPSSSPWSRWWVWLVAAVMAAVAWLVGARIASRRTSPAVKSQPAAGKTATKARKRGKG